MFISDTVFIHQQKKINLKYLQSHWLSIFGIQLGKKTDNLSVSC